MLFEKPSRQPVGRSLSFSVIICTHNRPRQLNECLRALSRLEDSPSDVLVVDNAPNHEETRRIALRWGARYQIEPMTGLSRARNQGALACDTELLAFLDDDAIPDPDWLSGLGREFEDERVMAVAGRIL